MDSINFLQAIGHTDRVYIRCLSPKNTPLSALEARGMTYTDKSSKVNKSTVNGYIELQTGELYRRYGKDHKPVTDGWGHLLELNQQGYGVYFVVGHGGEKNADITHGSTLFHESDRATLEQQQLEIDRISSGFGKPAAVVQTKKSLHAYWSSTETIPIENLATYQRRWLQYSNCDDSSLADPAQLMRLPGFDHLTWNSETLDFDRVRCELLQLNDVSYSLAEFERLLPNLDVDLWCRQSLEIIECDADDRDMRTLAQYLPGFDNTGKWIKAKCPAHRGESSDSLHIDPQTGGFICHAGCSSTSVYNASKAVAVAGGHRFEIERTDGEDLTRLLQTSDYNPSLAIQSPLRELIQAESKRWSLPSLVYVASLLGVISSLAKVDTRLNIRETTGKPILWFGMVGTSNSGKSESRNVITDPLKALQNGANEEYSIAYDNYECRLEIWEKAKRQKDGEAGDKPKEPGCREFYVSDYTYESLAHVYQYQRERCFLINIDELAGFFQFDKYGMGSNRDRILSLYDAEGMKVNRKSSKRIHIERTGLSVLGTIQHTTLARLLSKDDNKEDGLWARFAFIQVPTTPTYSHDPDPNAPLYTTLARTYATVNAYPPQTFGATPDAKALWTAWYNEMVDLTISQSGGFLESIYGKAKDRVARIALALHLLHAAAAGTQPDAEVSAETIHHAIELGKCLLLETERCFAMVGVTTDPDEERIINFVSFFTGKDWIDTERTRSWWSPKPKPTNQESRDFMAKVVSLGHAIGNEEPKDTIKFKIKVSKSGQNGQRNTQTFTQQAFNADQAQVSVFDSEEPELASSNGCRNLPSLTQSGQRIIENRDDFSTGTDERCSLTQSGQRFVNGSNPHEILDTDIAVEELLTTIGSASNAYISTSSDVTDHSDHVLASVYEKTSDKNLKIGDRVKLGEDIITIDKIEDDFIGGKSDDGSYVGGNRDSFQLVSDEASAKPTQSSNGYTKKDVGNRFIEIFSDSHSAAETITEEGEIEYDC